MSSLTYLRYKPYNKHATITISNPLRMLHHVFKYVNSLNPGSFFIIMIWPSKEYVASTPHRCSKITTHYFTRTNSILRFAACPAAVAFVAIGLASPYPIARILFESIPRFTRYCLTASALF